MICAPSLNVKGAIASLQSAPITRSESRSSSRQQQLKTSGRRIMDILNRLFEIIFFAVGISLGAAIANLAPFIVTGVLKTVIFYAIVLGGIWALLSLDQLIHSLFGNGIGFMARRLSDGGAEFRRVHAKNRRSMRIGKYYILAGTCLGIGSSIVFTTSEIMYFLKIIHLT